MFPNWRRTGVTSAALILGLLALSAAEAPAQSLFGSIFESLGIRQQRPAEPAPQAYAPAQPGFDERYPAPDAPRYDRPAADAGISGGGATHCIRLCDGRHFPGAALRRRRAAREDVQRALPGGANQGLLRQRSDAVGRGGRHALRRPAERVGLSRAHRSRLLLHRQRAWRPRPDRYRVRSDLALRRRGRDRDRAGRLQRHAALTRTGKRTSRRSTARASMATSSASSRN